MSDNKKTMPPEASQDVDKQVCGIIMPIAPTEGYNPTHWIEVRSIIDQCVFDAGFQPKMVSEADETGFIHQRIVENIYSNKICICDISSRNPNVMFELGIRLAFDRPVVIIKDDKTPRIFDTDILEYIEYPSSLRYGSVTSFREVLTKKIVATYSAYNKPGTSMFLHFFKNVTAKKLDNEELSQFELLFREFDSLKKAVNRNSNKREIGDTIESKSYEKFEVGFIKKIVVEAYLKASHNGDFASLKAEGKKSASALNISLANIARSALRIYGPKAEAQASAITAELVMDILNADTFDEMMNNIRY